MISAIFIGRDSNGKDIALSTEVQQQPAANLLGRIKFLAAW